MSKELLENILSYMAYGRGHSAGEEEIEAIKREMMADFEPIFKRIEELEADLLDTDNRRRVLSAQVVQLKAELKDMTSDRDSWEAQSYERAKDAMVFIEQRDALLAHVERLREALTDVVRVHGYEGGTPVEVLAATPAQSLARLRNQVREECIEVARLYGTNRTVEAIRAMKEPG